MEVETRSIELPEDISGENKNYIFGKKLGNLMGGINPKLQYEASMMAMTFILLGSLFTAIYLIIWTDTALFLKITIGVNIFFGMIFMLSFLVTTFQQYQNYLAVNDVRSILNNATTIFNSEQSQHELMKGGNEDGEERI